MKTREQHIILKEIIWEITGQCNNNCYYCGSKEARRDELNEDNIGSIAREIVKYPPKSINISGGDPLLVSYDTHKYITELFNEYGIECKILFNSKSTHEPEILELYDWIGLSINEGYDTTVNPDWFKYNNVTIISNFNSGNIWRFDDILKVVKKYNTIWMIQFTMYHPGESSSALYGNPSAVEYLQDKIDGCGYDKIIIADNANTTPCGMGLHTMGILSDGSPVACLSMRSWTNINDEKYLSLLEDYSGIEGFSSYGISKLQYGWENFFGDYRFAEFTCCKDICNDMILTPPKKLEELIIPVNSPVGEPSRRFPSGNNVMVYGVATPTMLYGVVNDNIFNTEIT